jgi:hypothetical protein
MHSTAFVRCPCSPELSWRTGAAADTHSRADNRVKQETLVAHVPSQVREAVCSVTYPKRPKRLRGLLRRWIEA